MKRRADRALLALLVVSVALPVALLVLRALAPTWFFPAILPDAGTPFRLRGAFPDGRVWRALGVSLTLAVATGVIGTVVAFFAGRTLARASAGVRQLAAFVAFLPVIAPPIALGVGLQVVVLQAGLGGGFAGVLIAHLIPAIGYLSLYFLGVLTAYDTAMEDEARTLGASPWQVLARVTIPALKGRIVESVLLGSLVSWGQLALTLLVGGGAVRTLPVELLSYVRAGDDRIGAAAALLLTVPPALAIGLLSVGARRTGVAT